MDDGSTGQVTDSAAKLYDEAFVPALFAEWAAPLCDAAEVRMGDRALDIGCGTGATTAELCRRTTGVIGLDRNEGMLQVARARLPQAKFVKGIAEDMPFEDGYFDVVTCQFALMFFEDRAKALSEMVRVLAPAGRIALSVWQGAATSPGYHAMIELIEEMFGAAPADALRAPFVLGDRDSLERVLGSGGLTGASITSRTGTARFPTLADWVRMDVRAWTLSDMIDDEGLSRLVSAAEARLGQFAGPDGRVAFDSPGHVVLWRKPVE